jgi:hypothetical protein
MHRRHPIMGIHEPRPSKVIVQYKRFFCHFYLLVSWLHIIGMTPIGFTLFQLVLEYTSLLVTHAVAF